MYVYAAWCHSSVVNINNTHLGDRHVLLNRSALTHLTWGCETRRRRLKPETLRRTLSCVVATRVLSIFTNTKIKKQARILHAPYKIHSFRLATSNYRKNKKVKKKKRFVTTGEHTMSCNVKTSVPLARFNDDCSRAHQPKQTAPGNLVGPLNLNSEVRYSQRDKLPWCVCFPFKQTVLSHVASGVCYFPRDIANARTRETPGIDGRSRAPP